MEKNIIMQVRNAANTAWVQLFPKTKLHLVEAVDDSSQTKYKLGIDNGLLYYEEVV